MEHDASYKNKKPMFFVLILKKNKYFLAGGEHTLVKTYVAPKIGGLTMFAKKKKRCIGCNAVLDKENAAVCPYCKTKESEIYQKEVTINYN